MVLVETPVFTRGILALIDDEHYRQLQLELVARPESGVLIRGSGGLRKLRWYVRGGGKRGGLRVIYYWAPEHDVVILLFVYAKKERDDLSAEQLSILRKLVEKEYK